MRASDRVAAVALLIGVPALLAGRPALLASPRPRSPLASPDRPSPSPGQAGGRPADPDRDERLRALPYSGWATATGLTHGAGVTRYVRGAAFEGLNLFALTSRSEAWLLDMQGTRLHTWASERGQPDVEEDLPSFFRGWQDVAVDAEGCLYALVSRDRVLKLAPDSRLLWEVPLRAHHDLSLGPDGSVYTLTDELRVVDEGGPRRHLVFDNDVVRIGSDGVVLSRLSLLDVLRSDPTVAARLRAEIETRFADLDARGLRATLARAAADPRGAGARVLLAHPRLAEVERALAGDLPLEPDRETIALLRDVPRSPSDVLHANAVRVLDRWVPGLGRRGDLLVSIRDLDLVVVIDPVRRRLRWSWGPGVIEHQHDPSVMPNGDLLLFDNRPQRGASRVVEVVPASRAIVWEHGGFFSRTRGGGQALPNGDVLILETEGGRAFELTRAGEVVWEFYDPDEAGSRGLALRQMLRIGGAEEARLRRGLGL